MPSNERYPVIDSAVIPAMEESDDLRPYLPSAVRELANIPLPPRYWYPKPGGEYTEETAGGAQPGSDPDRLAADVLGAGKASAAVLLPLTRGLQPNLQIGSGICTAVNAWLADRWLDRAYEDGRFYGTIRVNPGDPERAVEEIERWAEHPRMVQVGVPTEALAPYGHRQYDRIWEAAAKHDLPVAVRIDGGAGIDFFPTVTGFPSSFTEYSVLTPANHFYHLSSLIAEGSFERYPGLRFVFADGGLDYAATLMWRMDNDWPITRIEVPWVSRRPTHYLPDHVRFCTAKFETPEDEERLGPWLELSGLERLSLYASHYPTWKYMPADELLPSLPRESRRALLSGNAAAWYPKIAADLGLDVAAGASAEA
jgi:predicted TIM-barrel fold metal-dependent hydrolase